MPSFNNRPCTCGPKLDQAIAVPVGMDNGLSAYQKNLLGFSFFINLNTSLRITFYQGYSKNEGVDKIYRSYSQNAGMDEDLI